MHVVIDNLRPDMELGADLKDAGGRLLLPKGTVLTEKHIRYCQMWGIVELEIAGPAEADPPAEPVIDPVLVAKAEEATEPRFKHVSREHAVIDALFRHCVNKQLARKSA